MKADRIGALVTALPFAVAGALLFAGWLWASRQHAPAAPARPGDVVDAPAIDQGDDSPAGADRHSR